MQNHCNLTVAIKILLSIYFEIDMILTRTSGIFIYRQT